MRHELPIAFAPPGTVPKPQGMGVSRALWPHRINEFIVDVLLCVVDDALNIVLSVVDERAQPDSVVLGQRVVHDANRCVQIFDEQSNDLSLIKIRGRHLDACLTTRLQARLGCHTASGITVCSLQRFLVASRRSDRIWPRWLTSWLST